MKNCLEGPDENVLDTINGIKSSYEVKRIVTDTLVRSDNMFYSFEK